MMSEILDTIFDIGFVKSVAPWFLAFVFITACWGAIRKSMDADIERKNKRWSLIIMLDLAFFILVLIIAVVKRMIVG